ncbi:MAG TPA: FHA domain-containing protein [Chloroflexia bacterium]|nr:FHA domain-containing protein [Chloroflexia bacterium]
MASTATTGEEKSVSLIPYLMIIKGPQRGTTIPLDLDYLAEKPLVLGRLAGEADVVLQTYQNRVSRKHAVIYLRKEDELVVVADAGSSNGTLLNGQYIACPAPLFPGDTITCGDVDLVLVIPIEGMGLPLGYLPGQTGRQYLEDSEPGVARLEVVSSRVPYLRPGMFCRLTPKHPFVMGRYTTNDLVLVEEGETARLVSRRHAEIRYGNGAYFIRDLGAANPAWVNQNRIETALKLEDGDSIQVGSTLLRFRASRLPLLTRSAEEAQTTENTLSLLRYTGTRRALAEGPLYLRLPADRQVLIGRSEANDLRLFDPSVSRRHARLFFEANHYLLTDLGSANGTRLNGQEISEPVVLRSGDRLQIGAFEFTFQVTTSEEVAQSDWEAIPLNSQITFRLGELLQPAIEDGQPQADSGSAETSVAHTQLTTLINHPLRRIAPFDDLDSATFKLITPYFKEIDYKAGQEMAREGQGKGAFFAILEGRVTVSRYINEKQRLVIGELEPGSVYGERTVMANAPFPNRLDAITPVKALRLDESVFVREFSRNRAVLTFFQQQVSAASATNWMRSTLLMRTLSDTTRNELAKRLRYRVYQHGEILSEAGQPAEEFFLVVGGLAGAYVKDSTGNEVFLAPLEEGDTFGDGIASAGETYAMTVKAERKVECYMLTRADFESVLAKSGDPVASLGTGLGGLPLGAVLNRVGPFMLMPPQLVAKIGAEMRPKFFKKGETIVSQDEPASAFYIIRSGKVEVSFRTSEGEIRSDMQLGPGQYFGEASLLTNTARTDTVKAVEDCELLALYRNKLEAVLQLGAGYDLAQYFTKGLSKRFRPRRSSDVSATEHYSASGEHYYLLAKAEGEQFFKLSERSYFLWNLMNGDNSLNDLSMAYFLEFKTLDLEGVSNLVGQLQAGGFLEVPALDESLLNQTGKRKRSLLSRVLNWQVEFKNVDRFFTRLYNYGGMVFFWKPVTFLMFFLILAGFAAFIYYGFFSPMAKDIGVVRIFQGGGLGAFTIPGALPWWFLMLVLLLNFVIHELGHGLALKAFGRRVIGAGFGLQYGGPVFFVNTNELWLEGRRARVMVNLAGVMVNAVFAGTCCLLMLLSNNSNIQIALFQMAAIAYTLVYLNINPLMELDGYYALADWLEIPGLRRKSLTYVRRKLLKRSGMRQVSPREHRIYWWFAALTPVYLIFTLVQFLFFLTSVLGSFGIMLDEPWNRLLPLLIVVLLAWPLLTELLTIGRDDDEQESAVRLRRRRRSK